MLTSWIPSRMNRPSPASRYVPAPGFPRSETLAGQHRDVGALGRPFVLVWQRSFSPGRAPFVVASAGVDPFGIGETRG